MEMSSASFSNGPHFLVTESETSKFILHQTLGHRVLDDRLVRTKPAGNYSAAISLARTILLSPEKRVALVLDSESVDPADVAQRQAYVEAALAEVAVRSEYRVFLAVPEVEVWLFQSAEVRSRLLADAPGELTLRATTEPRRVLQELIATRGSEHYGVAELKALLRGIDLSPLNALPQIKQIGDYLLGQWAMAQAS
jgi:hypothetical protein